jgi:hypothetical protein
MRHRLHLLPEPRYHAPFPTSATITPPPREGAELRDHHLLATSRKHQRSRLAVMHDEVVRRLTGAPAGTQPSIDVVEVGAGRAALSMEGGFEHPHWLAQLAAALANDGVSIISGSATRSADHAWLACFELDTSHASSTFGARGIAFSLRQPPIRVPGTVQLVGWTVQRRGDDLLELRIQAEDSVGFLGRLLQRLALLALIPVELRIRTDAGRIDDEFVLARAGGATPPKEVEEALANMLAASMPPPT